MKFGKIKIFWLVNIVSYETISRYWKILLLGFFVCETDIAKAQHNETLEYGLLVNNNLYIEEVIPEGYHMGIHKIIHSVAIRKYDLSEKSLPVLTDLGINAKSDIYGFPSSWTYSDSYFYALVFLEGGPRMRPGFELTTVLEETRDTTLVSEDNQRFFDSIATVYPDKTARFKFYSNKVQAEYVSRNNKIVDPLKYLLRNLEGESRDRKFRKEGAVCFDVLIKDDGYFDLFIRDRYHFSRWEFNYALGGHDGYKDVTYWEILKAYTKDSVYLFEPEMYDDNYMPYEEDFSFNSISDSSFYDGQFEVVSQRSIIYIINTSHGAIYRVDEKKITKVAQVDLSDYPKLAGKHLFIEDLDKHQLIFFAPVKVLTKDGALPDIEVITEENVIGERFGVLF